MKQEQMTRKEEASNLNRKTKELRAKRDAIIDRMATETLSEAEFKKLSNESANLSAQIGVNNVKRVNLISNKPRLGEEIKGTVKAPTK